MTKVAIFLDDPDLPNDVYDILEKSEAWKTFVAHKLLMVSELWESNLGEDE